MEVLLEIGIILILLVANGVFAMAEISVVSARKARLRQMAEEGSKRAGKALELAESPSRFLSTVQIGISLVGIIAGAYGGSRLAGRLAGWLAGFPALAGFAEPLAFGLVVAVITYLSLVIGELVPKRIGLSHAEVISSVMAGPMQTVSKIAKPLVRLLSASTEGLIRVMGVRSEQEAKVTEDEVRLMVREGLRAGVLHKTESEMLESVMALDQLTVREIMTPRAKMIWVQADEPHETLWHKIVVSAHTSYPVYEKDKDRVLGMVTVKAIYAQLAAGVPVRVRDLTAPPVFAPLTQSALALLDSFKRSGRHVAVVVDEYGGVAGLVTLHDLMEAIVGDFPSLDDRLRPRARRREDGSWLVDAMLPIEEFAEAVDGFPLEETENRDYSTFGGYIIKKLGRVPSEGESFQEGDYMVEIIDMDQHRIDKVVLLPVRKARAG